MAQEDRNKLSDIVKNRLIGTIVSLLVFLVGFYVQSFAKASDVEMIKSKHEQEIQRIDAKIEKVLTGLCIIDPRTCELK
jgi:hypothetical protein